MMRVRPEWIDFNGHLNMAYYNVLFDTSVDQAYELLGFGPDYQKTGCTTYVAEFHVCYVRELHENDEVFVTLQILDHDAKRFHTYQELYHADGWLAATAEGLTLHVDQSGPRVAEMPRISRPTWAGWQRITQSCHAPKGPGAASGSAVARRAETPGQHQAQAAKSGANFTFRYRCGSSNHRTTRL